jgi:plasmid stability protein
MKKTYPSEAAERFIIRLPDGMRDRIRIAAEANNRSMNAEIVAVLEEKFPAPVPTQSVEDILKQWAPRIMAANDHKTRAQLIDEANDQLAAISRQATIGLFSNDEGKQQLGLIWQTSIVDPDDEETIAAGERVFGRQTIK